MTSVIRYTPLVILRIKNPRIWPQPTKFQYLSEIFKLEFQGSPPSGPLFFKKRIKVTTHFFSESDSVGTRKISDPVDLTVF